MKSFKKKRRRNGMVMMMTWLSLTISLRRTKRRQKLRQLWRSRAASEAQTLFLPCRGVTLALRRSSNRSLPKHWAAEKSSKRVKTKMLLREEETEDNRSMKWGIPRSKDAC